MTDEASDILLRFGERLRCLRKERNFSQKKFAEICEVDRTFVSGIERGERNVSVEEPESSGRQAGLASERSLLWTMNSATKMVTMGHISVSLIHGFHAMPWTRSVRQRKVNRGLPRVH